MNQGKAYPGECIKGSGFDLKFEMCLPDNMVDCTHILITPPPAKGTTPAPERLLEKTKTDEKRRHKWRKFSTLH